MTSVLLKLYLSPFSVPLNIILRHVWTTTVSFHVCILFNAKYLQRTTLSIYRSSDFYIGWHLEKQNTQLMAYLGHATISSDQAINMRSRIYECLLSRRSYGNHVANVLTSLGVPVNISEFETWWEVPACFPNWDFSYSQVWSVRCLCWDVTSYILVHIYL
jgi:hypothetical protein